MPSYQFELLNDRGWRSCLCVTACASDRDAVLRANALLASDYARVQVWRGDEMIHDGLKTKGH